MLEFGLPEITKEVNQQLCKCGGKKWKTWKSLPISNEVSVKIFNKYIYDDPYEHECVISSRLLSSSGIETKRMDCTGELSRWVHKKDEEAIENPLLAYVFFNPSRDLQFRRENPNHWFTTCYGVISAEKHQIRSLWKRVAVIQAPVKQGFGYLVDGGRWNPGVLTKCAFSSGL